VIRRILIVLAAGLVVLSGAGPGVSPVAAQPQAPPAQWPAQRCFSVLPRQTVEPILAKYRDRIRAARGALVKEERALRALLIADNATRAALDAQIAKTIEARNALARARLDALWELRAVIPAQDRALAFRCVERLLLRVR